MHDPTAGGLRPLIHIGYHKTASTWLQRMVFRQPDFGFAWLDVDPDIWLSHPLRFDAARARAVYGEQMRAAAAGNVPVLSNERLSGHPHSGGYDSALIAQRLKDVFADGRVLMVIREQRASILSAYKQYVKKGGVNSLKRYLTPKTDGHVPQFNAHHFAYDALIERYFDLFGRENVQVLSYEQFVKDPGGFLHAVTEFSGVAAIAEAPVEKKLNAQAPAATVWLKAKLNPFIRADTVNSSSPYASPIGAAIGLPIATLGGRLATTPVNNWLQNRWKRVIDERFAGFFDESNRRTFELTGVDLRGD